MPANRVSATFSAADQKAVLDALNVLRQKMPFPIDLAPADKQSLPKVGGKGRDFVNQALQLATQNPDFLPRSFDVEEMQRDVALFLALQPIATALTQLQELVDDTLTSVGSEAYIAALLVYRHGQAGGQGAALDSLLDEMGRRFARKSRGSADPATPNKTNPA